jgi:hypothetical protein
VRPALALTFALLLATGCAGGGARLTQQEFAQKADAICAKGRRQTQALPSPVNLTQLARVANETVDILDRALDDLRRLKPPSRSQALVDQWLSASDRLKDDVADIGGRARDKDRRGVLAAAAAARKRNARVNRLATRLGLAVCNKD